MGASEIARIAYGRGRIELRMDPELADWSVLAPRHEPALPNGADEFRKAVRHPIGGRPLRGLAAPGESVVIVTSDGTRPVPNRLLIPWILDELGADDSQVTVLLGTGTHRPNTAAEIEAMFGPEIPRRVRIVNHSAFDNETNTMIGRTASGAPVWLDRAYLEADRRIVVGFIEPHFFAGFSGGPKGVAPGVAGIETILHLHNYDLIAHPMSAYGVLEGNPIQAEIREMVAMAPPDFLVNVALNGEKEITAFFCGDMHEAHAAGCARAREAAMSPVDEPFDIVVTSNSGFPLDQNLYQAVKGISAADRIATDGGTIFIVAECGDGIPSHGRFGELLRSGDTPEATLAGLRALPGPVLDQWQAQILSDIQTRRRVELYAALDEEAWRIARLPRVTDLQSAVEQRIAEVAASGRIAGMGRRPRAAVLPDGPLTIPYIAAGGGVIVL